MRYSIEDMPRRSSARSPKLTRVAFLPRPSRRRTRASVERRVEDGDRSAGRDRAAASRSARARALPRSADALKSAMSKRPARKEESSKSAATRPNAPGSLRAGARPRARPRRRTGNRPRCRGGRGKRGGRQPAVSRAEIEDPERAPRLPLEGARRPRGIGRRCAAHRPLRGEGPGAQIGARRALPDPPARVPPTAGFAYAAP